MTYSDQDVIVGASNYGLGVFARRPFGPTTLIGPIGGHVVDDPDYESDYCMDLGGDLSLEPGFPFRYVNHSCRPNCALVQVEVEYAATVVNELWLEVQADVATGDQLTIDYGWPAAHAERCLCGDPECRGWIVSAAEAADISANLP